MITKAKRELRFTCATIESELSCTWHLHVERHSRAAAVRKEASEAHFLHWTIARDSGGGQLQGPGSAVTREAVSSKGEETARDQVHGFRNAIVFHRL